MFHAPPIKRINRTMPENRARGYRGRKFQRRTSLQSPRWSRSPPSDGASQWLFEGTERERERENGGRRKCFAARLSRLANVGRMLGAGSEWFSPESTTLQGWDSMARRWFSIWFSDMYKLPKSVLNHYWSKTAAKNLQQVRKFCAPLNPNPGLGRWSCT